MPRRSGVTPPKYCLHKASGQAVVRINGKDIYLGPHGSAESHEAYARCIAEWRLSQTDLEEKRAAVASAPVQNLTITEVVFRYREFAKVYYSKDGKPTKELADMKYALRPVRKLYGTTPAAEFGPLKLKAVRQAMVDSGELSRGVRR